MALSDDLAMIAHQERGLRFQQFDESQAWKVGSLLRRWGSENQWPIVVDVRTFNRQLFFSALPGSTPDNADWVHRKYNVVKRYHRSSYAVGLEMAAKDSSLAERYDLPLRDYAAHGGAFPIAVVGASVVGCVTVSGLSQRQDHAVVVSALCDVLDLDVADFALSDPAAP